MQRACGGFRRRQSYPEEEDRSDPIGVPRCKYVVYVSNQEDLPYDVSIGDDICDMAGMVLNWSSKIVKMFTEVTHPTHPTIVAKADRLDVAFANQDFRLAGGRGSRL